MEFDLFSVNNSLCLNTQFNYTQRPLFLHVNTGTVFNIAPNTFVKTKLTEET